MAYNVPAGADEDSLAPWHSYSGEKEEVEYNPEDYEDDLFDQDDEDHNE